MLTEGQDGDMFRRSSDGIAVPASVRTNDGSILIGTINCGMSGRLDSLLMSDVTFIEFVSKDGQQRFIAHHQIASIEPLASTSEPSLPQVIDGLEPFSVLGITADASLERAKAAFLEKLRIYSPQRWTGPDIPFEFSRYAAEKTRQINMAFTMVRGTIQARVDEEQKAKRATPMFGAVKATA
jgi:hypothetical protein